MSDESVHVEIPAPQGKGKAVVFSLITLLSGVIIGAGLTLILTNALRPKPAERNWEAVSVHMLRRMEGELGLSPEQKEKLEPIIQQHMKAMDDLRREGWSKIETLTKEMNKNILSILDDHQKQVWQDQIKKMQERFARFGRDRNRRGDRDGRRPGDRRGPGEGMGPMGPGMDNEGPSQEKPWRRGPEGQMRPEQWRQRGEEGMIPPPPDPNKMPMDQSDMGMPQAAPDMP